MNEIIAHEWTTLRGLWEVSDQTCLDADSKQELLEIFPAPGDNKAIGKSEPEDWLKFNRAEQLVGRCLEEPRLEMEFRNLMVLAEQRQIPSLKIHRRNEALFLQENEKPGESDEEKKAALERKRAAYQSLLYALQSGFVEWRYQRTRRKSSAQMIAAFGYLLLTALAILIIALFWTDTWQKGFRNVPWLAWIAVVVFGVVGAYFSRLLQFQATLQSTPIDDAKQIALKWSLLLRLGSGMIGAVVLYLLLCAGLIEGEFFPKIEIIGVTALKEWVITVSGTVTQLESKEALSNLTSGSPVAEEAKLFIWSFIAGFSERLVPSALESTEARSKG